MVEAGEKENFTFTYKSLGEYGLVVYGANEVSQSQTDPLFLTVCNPFMEVKKVKEKDTINSSLTFEHVGVQKRSDIL